MPIEQKTRPTDYYRIAAIVDDWLDDHDLPPGFFAKALKWAIRGLEKVQLNHWQDVKTCLFDVTDRKTVILPDDFVDWVKVGAPVGQYCITLGTNDDLMLTRRESNIANTVTLMSQDMPNGINFSNYEGHYFFNYNGRQLFGAGAGIPSKGYYRVHDTGTCKELLLDYDYGHRQLYIEYITNGFDPCGETVVNPYLKEYLLAYLDFMYETKNNPKANESTKDRAGQLLAGEITILRANRSNLTPKVLLNLGRKAFKLTPKV